MARLTNPFMTVGKKTTAAILIILLLIKIGMHLPILLYGMPYALGNVDENDFVGAALKYGASKTLKPLITWYPALYSYLLAFAIGMYYVILVMFSEITTINDFALHYLLYPGYFHLVGRLLSLFLACSSLIIIYLCGKNLKNGMVGIFAGFCFTFSYIVLNRTAWALPESTYILTTIIFLYFIIRFNGTGKLWFMILAGLFCGFSLSTKYNAGPLLLIGLSAAYLANAKAGENIYTLTNVRKFLSSPLVYYFLLYVVIGFVCGSPYWLLEIKENIAGLQWEIGRLNAKNGSDFWFSGIPYVWIFSELVRGEHILGLIFVLTIFWSIYRGLRGDRTSLLFVPFLIISLILVGKYQKHSIRYFLPAFPILFLLAGICFYDFIKNKKMLVGSAIILAMIIGVLLPIDNSITYCCSYLKKDIRLSASEWILKNIPFGTTIAVGKTSNAPPLLDSNRFDKAYYSSISEQILSKELAGIIKLKYRREVEARSYNIVNYIVKRSFGRGKSYSEMRSDIAVTPYEEIIRSNPRYLITSSSDKVYFEAYDCEDIQSIPGYSENLELLKSFHSNRDENQFIRIYRLTDGRGSKHESIP